MITKTKLNYNFIFYKLIYAIYIYIYTYIEKYFISLQYKNSYMSYTINF